MRFQKNLKLMCDDKNERNSCDLDRELWVHEDNLINNRITWLGVTQGLLFTAYGIVLIKGSDITTNQDLIKSLQEAIPWLGIATSSLVFIGVLAAAIAMVMIKSGSNMKRFGISWVTTIMGLICGLGMPSVFAVTWFCIAH